MNEIEATREVEQILSAALESERLSDHELCQRLDMAKVLAEFPEIRVKRVGRLRKVTTPFGVWAYGEGTFRSAEREELDKLAFCGLLYGVDREVAVLTLGSRPELWREEGEAPIVADHAPGEQEPGFTFADLDLILPGIEWEWEPWLPKGMVTLLVGATGIGKSSLALAIASAVVQGTPWPDGTPSEEEPGLVVWIESEYCIALTRERITKWGIPEERILIPAVSDDPLDKIWLDTREGWAALHTEARRNGVKLVILDSLRGAYKGDENASDTILLLGRLADLAQRYQVPVLTLHHLRKKGLLDGQKINLDRVRGSSAIVQVPRCVWAIDKPDALVPDRIRLHQIKNNLARFPEPCGFEISETGITFTDAPGEPKVETQRDKAADLLLALLRDGPILATEMYQEAEGAGIGKATLNRAKKALGVVARRKEGCWWWALPAKG